MDANTRPRRLATGVAYSIAIGITVLLIALASFSTGCDPNACDTGECEGAAGGCCSCSVQSERGRCTGQLIPGMTCTVVWDFTGMCGCCAYCCR